MLTRSILMMPIRLQIVQLHLAARPGVFVARQDTRMALWCLVCRVASNGFQLPA